MACLSAASIASSFNPLFSASSLALIAAFFSSSADTPLSGAGLTMRSIQNDRSSNRSSLYAPSNCDLLKRTLPPTPTLPSLLLLLLPLPLPTLLRLLVPVGEIKPVWNPNLSMEIGICLDERCRTRTSISPSNTMPTGNRTLASSAVYQRKAVESRPVDVYNNFPSLNICKYGLHPSSFSAEPSMRSPRRGMPCMITRSNSTGAVEGFLPASILDK